MASWSEIGKTLKEKAARAKQAVKNKFSSRNQGTTMSSEMPQPTSTDKTRLKKIAGAAAAGGMLAGAALKKSASLAGRAAWAAARPEQNRPKFELNPRKITFLLLLIVGAIIVYTLAQKINVNAFTGFVITLAIITIGSITLFYPKFGKELAGWGMLALAAYAAYFFLRTAISQQAAGAIAITLLILAGLYRIKPSVGGPILSFLGAIFGLIIGTLLLSIMPLGLPAIFIPIFIITYFIMVFAATSKRWLFRIGFLFVAVLLIFYLNMNYPTFVNEGSPMYKAFQGQQRAWLSIGETIGLGVTEGIPQLAETVGTEVRRQIMYMQGDYEVGIEESQDKPLGVFLENMKVIPAEIYLNGKVTALAHLRATALEGKSFDVKVECKAGNAEGTIKPRSKFDVQQHEEMDLNCGIDAVNIGRGKVPVKMKATFDFTTGAFLTTYFMRQDTIRAMRLRGIENPLDEFAITNKNPFAKFSPGPVRIGMGLSQPVALLEQQEAGSEYGPVLKITLEKNWNQGKITKLHELKITAPPGVTIEDVNNFEIDKQKCTKQAAKGSPDRQPETTCTLDEKFLGKIFPEGIQIETIAVQTGTASTNDIMQIETPEGQTIPQQLAIRSFKAEVKYTYEIEQSADVVIKALPERNKENED